MKKFFLIVLMILALSVSGIALAADNGADPLTLQELESWRDEMVRLACSTQPENDPKDAKALTEDGYTYIYSFGTLFFDTPELTEDSVLNAFVIYDEEIAAPHGTYVDQHVSKLLLSYYSENAELEGSHDSAVIYLHDNMSSTAAWGYVLRDGQRIGTVQYSVCEQATTGGDGYLNAGIIYTIQDDSVAAIRVYGLSARQNLTDVEEELDIIREAATMSGYHAVPSGTNGKDLEMLNAEDLRFAGIDLLSATPEDVIAAFGTPLADETVENDTGYFRNLTFENNTGFTFLLDSDRANAVLSSFEILDDGIEGPRALRVGDSLNSVIYRFRFGESELSGQVQPLYGQNGQAPYGVCIFDENAGAVIRYAFVMDDGKTGVLSLQFDMLELTGILFYTV